MISGVWRVSSWLLAGVLLLAIATVFFQAFFMTGVLPVTPWAVASDVENFSWKFFMTGDLSVTPWAVASDVENFSWKFFMTDDLSVTPWAVASDVDNLSRQAFAAGEGGGLIGQSGSYLLNSVVLVAGTVALSLLMGLPAAWLTAMYRFPGQRMLRWALCLPLAMPAFLLAYLYADALTWVAPLRDILGGPPDSAAFLCAACVILAMVLYPYIYLPVRHALEKQPASLIHSARLLNHSSSQAIWRVCLPLARPALVIGAALVALEVLGDYGTASYLAIPTLMTRALDFWLQQGDLVAAARIGMMMLPVAFLLLFLASVWRRKQQSYQTGWRSAPLEARILRGWRSAAAQFYCWSLVSLAFFLPLSRLAFWAVAHVMPGGGSAFLHALGNSVLASACTTALITFMALLFVFYSRTAGQSATPLPVRVLGLSYAIPGAVLAIGLFIPLALIEKGIGLLADSMALPDLEMRLAESLFILILAYSVKFGRLMLDGLQYRMATIPLSLDHACLVLKCSAEARWARLHIPLLRRTLLTGAALIFSECMKELNVALLLRPFHIDTLASYVFRFTSGEQAASLALPALILVLAGVAPVVGLSRVLNIKG